MSDTPEGEELVSRSLEGHVALLTLNRPIARNAISPALALAMDDALDWAESHTDVRVVVLTGAGDVFCAGADLRAIASGSFAGIETEKGGFAGIVRRQRVKPLIAAVNGPALAGGCEIALACDIVLASSTARFGLPEVKRSLMAIEGGIIRLPRTIPRNIAMELVLTGDAISAERAAQLGMVNAVFEPGELLSEARRLADRIAANAPLAVQASRKALIDSLQVAEEDAWRIGWRAMKPLFASEDFQEGPRAFVEKRDPVWVGR